VVSPLDSMSSEARRGQVGRRRRAHSQPCSLCEVEPRTAAPKAADRSAREADLASSGTADRVYKGLTTYATMTRLWSILLAGSLCIAGTLQANPTPLSVFQQVRSELDDMRLKVRESVTTMELMEQRIASQEKELESLRAQLAVVGSSGSHAQEGEGPWKAIEKQLVALKSQQTQLQADIRQLQTHANETTSALAQYRKRMDGIDAHVDSHVGQLKGAVESIVAAVKDPAAPPISTDGSYVVRPGDTLGGIAQRHGLSIATLRQLNQLKGDRIVVGQKIKIS
jgi:LysM repeat protein